MTRKLALTTAIVAAMCTSEAYTATLEEIVVTAQKRSENVQDVPIAITGFSSKDIEEGRIQTTQDLQNTIPSLNWGSLSVFSKIYLRGIGTDIVTQGADGSVATYLDGVYIPGQSSQVQALLGTERIEVLSGPQGTLYGRNAVGGAINIYSLTPTQDTEAKLSVGAGDYSRREVSGHLSGAVTDTLSMGIYGGYVTRDTYYHVTNVNIPYFGFQNEMADSPDDELQEAFRLKGVWEPNDKLKVTASVEFSRVESLESGIFRNVQPNALAYGFEPYQQQNGAGSVFSIPGVLVDASNNVIDYATSLPEYLTGTQQLTPGVVKKYHYETNLPSYSIQEQTLGIVRFDYEMDSGIQLVSLTSYNDHDGQGADDIDGTAAPLIGSTSRDWGQLDETFAQEFQILAPADSKYQWIVGLYYLDQTSSFEPNDSYGVIAALSAANAFGQIIIDPAFIGSVLDDRFTNYGWGDAKSYAIYGQTTVPLDKFLEGLQLTLGLRYTYDEKEWRDAYTALEAPGLKLVTASFPEGDKKDWDKFTPKISLDYRHGNTLYYASFSQGYRAGMYNISAPQDIVANGALDPETLDAYEIGTKSDLMDERLRFNTSAWFYEFNDIQVNRVTTGGAGSGISATVQNAAKAEVYGAELTAMFAATDQLTLNAGMTFMHSEFTSFPNAQAIGFNTSPFYAPNAPIIVDATGNELVRSPHFVANASADYRIPMADNDELQFNISAYYNDGYFFNTANDLEQPSYTQLNGFVRYSFNDDKYAIKVWGKNLTDKFYYAELQNLVNVIALDAAPRTWGVTFTYNL